MLSDGTVTEAKLDSTVSNKVTNAYTQANNAYAKANTAIGPGGTVAGDLTISGNLTIGGTLSLTESFEAINVSATGMGANVNFDILSQSILYLTSPSTANSTINFRANSTISLESYMNTGNSLTVSMLVTNSGTGNKVNSVQVDSIAVTPKWAGGIAPSSVNPNYIDLYSFTIIKTASLTYTVLASQQKYA